MQGANTFNQLNHNTNENMSWINANSQDQSLITIKMFNQRKIEIYSRAKQLKDALGDILEECHGIIMQF